MEIFSCSPSYVDGHQHVHVIPLVTECLCQVMNKYNVIETRVPSEIDFKDCSGLPQQQYDFLIKVNDFANQAKSVFRSHSIRYGYHYCDI